MLSRGVVSISAFLAAAISVYFVVMTAIWCVRGQLGESETVMMLGGWLLSALIFGSRAADPDYLDPQSIIKGR
jgi:hypothetical protein